MRVTCASIFLASHKAVVRADSARRDPSRGTRIWRNTFSPTVLPSDADLTAEGRVQEHEVQREYDRGTGDCQDRREAPIHEGPHNGPVPREHDQGDDRNGQCETEDYLAHHQGSRGIEPEGDRDQRGNHRGDPPDPYRDAE